MGRDLEEYEKYVNDKYKWGLSGDVIKQIRTKYIIGKISTLIR